MPGMNEDRDKAFEELSARLDYHFTDRNLLLTAMCHRSFIHQIKDVSIRERLGEDNQRLGNSWGTRSWACASVRFYTTSFPI